MNVLLISSVSCLVPHWAPRAAQQCFAEHTLGNTAVHYSAKQDILHTPVYRSLIPLIAPSLVIVVSFTGFATRAVVISQVYKNVSSDTLCCMLLMRLIM
jgi:hypothetical protein